MGDMHMDSHAQAVSEVSISPRSDAYCAVGLHDLSEMRALGIDGHPADLVIEMKSRLPLIRPSDIVYDSLARTRGNRQELLLHLSVTFARRAIMHISVELLGRGDRVKAKDCKQPWLPGQSIPSSEVRRDVAAHVGSWAWEASSG